jgi:hypothetical protein
MPYDPTPLPQRVASSYIQLSQVAVDLNDISDTLGKCIHDINEFLKRLNLGVVAWVPIQQDEGIPGESWFWKDEIGYSKVGPIWGICLRKVQGDYQHPDDDEIESWFFNDAPRALRISAIDKIPDLLEKLSKEAAETTKRIGEKLAKAEEVLTSIMEADNAASKVRKVTPRQSKVHYATAPTTEAK